MLFIYSECKHNIRGITFWSSGTHVHMASLSLLFLLCVSLSFFHSFFLFLLGTEWSSSSISESFNEVDKGTLESIKTR